MLLNLGRVERIFDFKAARFDEKKDFFAVPLPQFRVSRDGHAFAVIVVELEGKERFDFGERTVIREELRRTFCERHPRPNFPFVGIRFVIAHFFCLFKLRGDTVRLTGKASFFRACLRRAAPPRGLK